jgi:hypothetical protein
MKATRVLVDRSGHYILILLSNQEAEIYFDAKGEFSLVKDLDPQVRTLLESFQAMAAQQPASNHILSTEERLLLHA